MARKIAVLILTVVIVLGTGCSGTADTIDITADEAADRILNDVSFRDIMTRAEGEAASNFYALNDTVAEHAIYLSTGATAEEIAVIKVKEGEAADLRQILEDRVEEQKFRYESYVPGEMVKLESPVIVSRGNMIIMIVADGTAAAEKTADEILGIK